MSEPTTILALREDCEFSRELRKRGYKVLNLPMIATRRAADLSRFRDMLASVERFDSIFLTSRASAEALVDNLTPDIKNKLPEVYVLGSRAKDILECSGVNVKYKDTANTADELLEELGISNFAGNSILFVRGDKSLRTIPTKLGDVASVQEVIVYETVDVSVVEDVAVDSLRKGDVDWLCFFSPSAVESFAGRNLMDGQQMPKIAAIGETTARAARSHGYSVDFVSERAAAVDFASGLVRHIESFE